MSSKLGHFTFALCCVAATCAAVYFIPLFAGGAAVGFGVAILKDRTNKYDESIAKRIDSRHN